MPNQYYYIDPEYAYTDPKTGVLRNLVIEQLAALILEIISSIDDNEINA